MTNPTALTCSLLCLLLLAGTAGAPLPASAQVTVGLGDLEAGQLIVNLSATKEIEVDQDTLNAALEYSVQGRDRIALQDEVNAAMNDALAILEGADGGIEYNVQQYNVYIVQGDNASTRNLSNPLWRARQRVSLTSMDTPAMLDLIAELQAAGLTMTNMYYSLSPDRMAQSRDSLLAGALGQLQERADDIAAILNKETASLIEVNVDGNGGYAPRQFTMEAASDSVRTPVAVPGTTRVMLTVTARALLGP